MLAVLAVEDVTDRHFFHKPWEIAGVVVVLLVVSVVYHYYRNTCPKCGRLGALKKTGKRGEAIIHDGEEEVKCKYCGDRHWREKPERGGG